MTSFFSLLLIFLLYIYDFKVTIGEVWITKYFMRDFIPVQQQRFLRL